MAFENLGVIANGLFSNNVFGIDPTQTPSLADVYSPNNLEQTSSAISNNDSQDFDSELFTKISPKGARNLSQDPTIKSAMQNTGVSMSDILTESLNSFPRDINSFGNLFDSGEFSFGQVNDIMGRLSGTLNRNSFDSIGEGDLTKIIDLTNKITTEEDSFGDLLCKLTTANRKNQTLGFGQLDLSALGGFLASMVSKLSGNGCMDAVLPFVNEYADELGIDANTMASVKKVLSKDLSSEGRLRNANDLINDLGNGIFTPSEKVQMATDMSLNYKKPDFIRKNAMASEATLLKSFMDANKPNWDKKNVNGNNITDFEVFKKSSDDFKEVMSYDPSYETIIALSNSAFA